MFFTLNNYLLFSLVEIPKWLSIIMNYYSDSLTPKSETITVILRFFSCLYRITHIKTPLIQLFGIVTEYSQE